MAKIWVRATINLQGINRGEVRPVNPDAPWIAEKLKAGYLVEVPRPSRRRPQ